MLKDYLEKNRKSLSVWGLEQIRILPHSLTVMTKRMLLCQYIQCLIYKVNQLCLHNTYQCGYKLWSAHLQLTSYSKDVHLSVYCDLF